MRRLRRLSRRSALWIGFFAVLGPLLVLLGFQFRWLATLAQDSAIARRATLENYLEAVTSEVRYHYSALAERGLNLPPSLFDGEPDLDEALKYFRQRVFDGANWLFIAYPAEGGEARTVFFDPRCECWGEPPDEQVQAVHVAAAPWLMLAQQGTILGSGGLHVDERNVGTRTILNPITDEARHVVGIAGMIVDPDEFRELVLPAAIEKSLPKFFSENPLTHFMVQVEDGGGDLLYTSSRPDGGEEDLEVLMAATRPFGFIFKDWGVAVQRHGGSAEEWARTNFLLNLTLSGLLGVLLIGGSVFTLRTAAREVRLSEMKSDFVSNVSHELRTH